MEKVDFGDKFWNKNNDGIQLFMNIIKDQVTLASNIKSSIKKRLKVEDSLIKKIKKWKNSENQFHVNSCLVYTDILSKLLKNEFEKRTNARELIKKALDPLESIELAYNFYLKNDAKNVVQINTDSTNLNNTTANLLSLISSYKNGLLLINTPQNTTPNSIALCKKNIKKLAPEIQLGLDKHEKLRLSFIEKVEEVIPTIKTLALLIISSLQRFVDMWADFNIFMSLLSPEGLLELKESRAALNNIEVLKNIFNTLDSTSAKPAKLEVEFESIDDNSGSKDSSGGGSMLRVMSFDGVSKKETKEFPLIKALGRASRIDKTKEKDSAEFSKFYIKDSDQVDTSITSTTKQLSLISINSTSQSNGPSSAFPSTSETPKDESKTDIFSFENEKKNGKKTDSSKATVSKVDESSEDSEDSEDSKDSKDSDDRHFKKKINIVIKPGSSISPNSNQSPEYPTLVTILPPKKNAAKVTDRSIVQPNLWESHTQNKLDPIPISTLAVSESELFSSNNQKSENSSNFPMDSFAKRISTPQSTEASPFSDTFTIPTIVRPANYPISYFFTEKLSCYMKGNNSVYSLKGNLIISFSVEDAKNIALIENNAQPKLFFHINHKDCLDRKFTCINSLVSKSASETKSRTCFTINQSDLRKFMDNYLVKNPQEEICDISILNYDLGSVKLNFRPFSLDLKCSFLTTTTVLVTLNITCAPLESWCAYYPEFSALSKNSIVTLALNRLQQKGKAQIIKAVPKDYLWTPDTARLKWIIYELTTPSKTNSAVSIYQFSATFSCLPDTNIDDESYKFGAALSFSFDNASITSNTPEISDTLSSYTIKNISRKLSSDTYICEV